VVLTDYGADDTPLFCATDSTVSEGCGTTDDTVGTDYGLLGFNYNGFLVPYERFFEYFENLLVDYWGFDTTDTPLVFSNQKRSNRVLDSHKEVVKLLQSLEV
jgi:hypothetical protein